MYSYVTIFRSIAKSNYRGEGTAYFPCHTISQQSSCHASDGQSQQRLVFEHGSFRVAFVKQKSLQYSSFSPGTYNSTVSIHILTLRTLTMTTVHAT